MTSKHIRVLLVEDNAGDARLIQEMLSEVYGLSFDIRHVVTLASGVQCLIEGEYDVVLLDLGLPDSKGLETFTRIYAHAWEVPIVVLSGLDDEQVALKSMQGGAQDYLIKGEVDSRTIWRVIRYAMERKRIEEALKTSEANYRAIFDAASDAIFVHDIETTKVVDVNRKGCELFCYPCDELLGLDAGHLMPSEGPYTKKKLEALLQKAVAGEPQVFEWLAKDKANRFFWVEVSMKRTVVGGVTRLLSIVRDINERKESEEALRRLEVAVEQALDGIAVADMEGKVQFVNPAWTKMHGLKVDEALGKDFSIFHTTAQMKKDVIPLNETVKKNGSAQGEIGHVKKDGKTFQTLMAVALLKDKEGRPTGMIATARDITERIRAQQALERQKEYYEKLLDEANIWIEVLDREGRVLLWNKKAEDVTGYKRKHLLGTLRKWQMEYPNAAYRQKVFGFIRRSIADGRNIRNMETEVTTYSGRKRMVSWSSSIIRNREGEITGGMFIGTALDGLSKKASPKAKAARKNNKKG
ncbi:MAG: PAS domain S-box protein [Candidatus Omnitrophica bacterium]|nr:PAS domain S-box protein [Candidatus Omnitrophota bacterium]